MLALALVALGGAACEGSPARSKPWRHAPDPTAPDPAAAAPDTSKPSPDTLAPDEVLREKLDRTLRVRLEVEPTHLFPLADPEREGQWVSDDTIFEPLVRFEPPREGAPAELVPALAESWKVVQGGREIRFQLRAGVQFHDGQPFSAADAEFSLRWALHPKTSRVPHLRQVLADIERVDMWGPRDLRIQLRRPNGYVLRLLALVPIVPQHVYTGGDVRRIKQATPVGTGPYRLSSWERGERIVLARNETYWGPPAGVEQIDFVVDPDGAHALVAAKQGAIDFLPSLIAAHYPGQLDAPGIDGVFRRLELRPPRFRGIVVHFSEPPFNDVRVREAAALLIDRVKIAVDVHGGLARPISGPAWPGGPLDAEAPPAPVTNAARAAALLDEAGWTLGKDGVRSRDGVRLRIALLVTNDSRGDLERDVIITAWRKAGIVVEPLPGDPAVLMNRLRAHTFQAALVEWRLHADVDLAPLFATGGALNWGELSSPAIDAALAEMSAAPDAVARRAKAAPLARLIAAEWPILPLTAPDPHGVLHGRVKDVVVRDGWLVLRRLRLEPLPGGVR